MTLAGLPISSFTLLQPLEPWYSRCDSVCVWAVGMGATQWICTRDPPNYGYIRHA
jgi:type IV secretory pathway TrbD component